MADGASTSHEGAPRPLPRLIGVVHLPPLPGSPRSTLRLSQIIAAAETDARALELAGFQGVIVENYGDAPFARGRVGEETVSAMTACALAVREAAPTLALGVNVLRNDAIAALAVALASEASMVRINVHIGARVTDQGIIEGAAHETLRHRKCLGLEGSVRLLCDVAVKHSAPLAPRPLEEETRELVERGLADAVLVTGSGTGARVDDDELAVVCRATEAPIYVASGAEPGNLPALTKAHGVIVGTALRATRRAGMPIDRETARAFAAAFFEVWGPAA